MEQSISKSSAATSAAERPFAEMESALERSGRVEDLLKLYETRAREVPANEASVLLCRAADVARDRLKSFTRAEEYLRRALLVDPAGLTPLEGLKRLFEQKQDLAALAETLERLASASGGEAAAAALIQAADIHEGKLFRRDRAILCLQRASQAAPNERSHHRRLRALALAEFRFNAAFDALEREREALGSEGLFDEYAALAERLKDDPTEHALARRVIDVARELSPEDPRIARIEAELDRFPETWRDRVRTLTGLLLEERDRKSAARMSLLVAKLHAWFDVAEGETKVKEALDRCLLLWPAMPDALQFLERQAAEQDRWPDAVAQIEKLAQESKDKRAAVELWMRAGSLQLSQLGNREAALAAFTRACEVDPSRSDSTSLAVELLIEDGKTAEAVALLDRHQALVKDRPARVELLLRLGDLCRKGLRDPSAARGYLEQALQFDPGHSLAAFELARLLADEEDLPAAAALLDAALLAPRPVYERVALCEAMALLYEEGGDLRSAVDVLGRALVLDPERATLRATLREQAERAEAFPQLAAALRRAAMGAPPSAAVSLWRELALVLQNQLRSPVDAQAAWREVLALDPEDPQAAEAVARLFEAVREAEDPRQRQLGVIQSIEDAGGDAQALIPALRELLALAPDDRPAAVKLQGLLSTTGGFEEAAQLAGSLARTAETQAERGEWQARLAALYAERLDRADEATNLFLRLLGDGFSTAAVLSGLERLAKSGVRTIDIGEALAAHYGGSGDHQRQVAALLVQLGAAQDLAQKKRLLATLSDTHERFLADSRAAFDARLRGVSADPLDEAFRAEAVRLARDLSATVELARFFRELAPNQDDQVARGLLFEAAELAEEGHAPDEALAALDEAVRRLPDDAELGERRVRLLVRAGRVSEAEEALDARVQRAPAEARAALLLQKVELCAELDRPQAAAEALEEAIRAGADEAKHMPRLFELLERAGKSAALVRALERGIAMANADGDADRAARLNVKRAQLLEGDLGSRAEAVKSYADVLRQRPTDPAALAALEGLLEEADCREEAARALVPAYEAIKDHRKLVVALEAIADTANDQVSRVQALRQAANAHRFHLRQPELAFAALARAVRMTPADAALRIAARQAAEDADQLESFAEILQEVLEGEIGTLAPSLHRELAELYEKKLDDRPAAVRELQAVLAREPRSIDALRSLQRLHRAGESWAELAAVLERMATSVLEPGEQAALMREAALLQENKLENPERAAELWRQLAERDPSSREVAGHLERLYTQLDRPEQLAFALEVRRAQEGKSPQGRELAFRLAMLRHGRLADPHGALQLLQTVLAEEPSHTGALDALEAWVKSSGAESAAALDVLDPVLKQAGDHQRRVALREARLDGAPREEQGRLFAEIRAIQERELERPDMAFLAALRAFSKGLERESLVADLERLARVADSFDDLAEVYEEATGELEAGDPERHLWLRRAAELQEQVGQPDESVRLWQALLAEAPQDHDALEALSRLFEQNKNARELSEVYARQAQLATEPAERYGLLMKAAQAYESAGAEEEAVEALKSALAIERTREALVALDRLYGRTDEVDAQADVLDQLAQLPGEPVDARRGHLVRRAQLLEREGRQARALSAWSALLAEDGGDAQAISGLERLLTEEGQRVEAARLLEPVYREARDHKKLVEVLELRLPQIPPEERLARLEEIATLREAEGQKSLAFAARLRAFSGFFEEERTHEELERLAADTGSFEEVAAAYEDALERGAQGQVAENLWRRLAYTYAERLNRLDAAARALEEVSRRAPTDLAVLESLGHVHHRAHAFRELADVTRRRVSAEPSVERQVALLFELAQLAEETLADKALAIGALQGVLERRSDDVTAIKLLERLYSETERYAELGQLLEREVELADAKGASEEACELKVRLGRLKLNRLDEGPAALRLYGQVLERRPAHPGAVGALEELARSEHPLRGAAASALEPVFASGGEHLKLVQMLESQVSAEPSPVHRAELLRRIAEAYAGVMENPEMGFVAATRALREQPDDPQNLELCLRLVGPADAEEELISELEEAAPRAVDETSRIALFRALARLQAQDGDVEASSATWRKLLELRGSDDEALTAMATLLREQGKTTELADILRRQAAMSEDPEVRAAVLVQLAALQEETLRDPTGALASLRRALEAKPDSVPALARLDALCSRLERWPELADVLVQRIALAGEDESTELHFRLGDVRETRLADRTGALESWEQALARDPNHPGALARLEALLAREPQNLTAVQVHLTALRKSGDPHRLTRGLDARVAVSPDPTERKSLLAELAALREAQGEPELAFLAYWRAYKEDPNDAGVRAKVVASAEAAESYDELVGALEEALPRISTPEEAAEVSLELGRLLESQLDEPDRAVNHYEKARTLSPSVSHRVLPALDRLYTSLDATEELAQVLEAEAALAESPADRQGLLFRLGQLAESRLQSPERAAAAYEGILEIDPKHLPSLRLLEPLYEAAGAHEKLSANLEIQQELAQGPERERVMTKRARVAAEGLEDPTASIALYRELLEKNPRNEQAAVALEALLERTGEHEGLRELLERRLAGAVDPRELARLNERLGRVLATMLERPEEALPYFRAALERDPRNRAAMESMRDLYEQLGRHEDLVTTLRRLIPMQESPQAVKALRLRLAEVLAELSRREESLDAARRAMEIEPHELSELERLQVIFTGLRAQNDAVRALELSAQVHLAAGEQSEAVEVYFSIAELWKSQGKPETAATSLEKVLETDPANRRAFEEIQQLYAQANDWRSWATTADRYVGQLVTDEEKLELLRTLARVQEERLHQKDTAFLTACRALQLLPGDDAVREDVERLAEETESYEELAAVYEEVAESVPRGPLAERMYLVLARVHDEHLDDPDEAEAALRKILEFDPANPNALEMLARIFQRRGRAKEYVVALEQKLEAAGSIEERKAILREIARVYEEQLDDSLEAATTLIRAIELEPDLQTVEVLTALYRREKNWPQVAVCLLRARDLAPTQEQQAQLQLQVGVVYERELQDDAAAVEAYGVVLAFDAGHPEALDALERLYVKLDRPSELLSVYERQLEATMDVRAKVTVLFKSAGIWEDRFQDLANADACIQLALSIDPANLQVIRALARLRRAQSNWEGLVQVLGHHVQVAQTAEEQAGLYVEMGEVYSQELRAVDRAASAYQYALQVSPDNRRALHALGVLYERTGNWPFALEMLQREAESHGSAPEAVELFHRIGHIQENMMQDLPAARVAYQQALAIDGSYLPSIRALKGVQEQERDWSGFEATALQEAQQSSDPAAKAKALLELARHHYETLQDLDGAIPYWEQALLQVPDSLDAARPLVDVYTGREDWEQAERMLDIVVRNLAQSAMNQHDEAIAGELARALYRLGYVSEKLGKREKALDAFEKAYQFDSTHLPTLEGYGHLLVATGRWEDAIRIQSAILIHHREELTDMEVVEVYWQLGDAYARLNQAERAENHYQKALELDPGHEPSLRGRIALFEAAGRWAQVAEARQRLVEVVEGEDRFRAGFELGRVAREKLNDPYLAIDAYQSALRSVPDAIEALDALYMLYRETGQAQKAAEVLERMLSVPALTSDPQRAKRVWYALGEVNRDDLRDPERAAEAFNAALDVDFRFLEAFSALESLLSGRGAWKQLEENYARMIQRLPKTEDTHAARLTLWRALGDLYRQVLNQPENAFMAYKVVASGLLDNGEVQEIFAQLAGKIPGQEEAALAAWRRALPLTSKPAEAVNALMVIGAQRRDYDGAWMAAQVGHGLLGESGEGTQEILAKLGPYAKQRETFTTPLTDRAWREHLFHPNNRGPLAELMTLLYTQAGQLWAVPFAQYGLNPRKHRIDPSSSQEYQLHHYRTVSRLFGMDGVEVYSPFLVAKRELMARKSKDPAPEPMIGIELLHSQPTCLKVGGRFFNETGQREVFYLLGRHLALLRPELALSQRVPAERLEAIVQAALTLVVPNFRVTMDLRSVDVERQGLMKTLTEPAKAHLAQIARAWLPIATPGSVRDFVEGAELTAVRAGYFVAQEAAPVRKLVQSETGANFRASPGAKLRELTSFGVSDDLRALREGTGINVLIQR